MAKYKAEQITKLDEEEHGAMKAFSRHDRNGISLAGSMRLQFLVPDRWRHI